MGMLTSRRLREREAAERSGLPPPAPRLPDEIPYHQHVSAMQDLKHAHAAELAALRKEIAALRGPVEAARVTPADPEAEPDEKPKTGPTRGRATR